MSRFLVRDVRALLPPNWRDDVAALSELCGTDVQLKGGDPTSRKVDGRAGKPDYRVTTTGPIAQHLPWLCDLYWGAFHKMAREIDPDCRPMSDEVSAININACRPGTGYEWHVDPNSPTGLLFVTTAGPGDGGHLLMRFGQQHGDRRFVEMDIAPVAGVLLMFDAREAPHCVTGTSVERITIPLTYLGKGQVRDSDDAYLYGRP